MSALAVNPAYTALLTKYPPRVIKTEAENEHFIELLYALDTKQGTLSLEEQDLADLLTLLVEDFEEKHYSLPKSSPSDMLRFLMDQRGWQPDALTDLFGSGDACIDVLNGHRQITEREILALSERFQVSPDLFR